GPKVLEHLVDTVLYFEGDKDHNYRMVRVVKNRFGPTDEVAVFQMTGDGLKEVANPSQIFLEERKKDVAGSVIVPTLEGSRPILVEIQALVTPTVFPTPTRKSTGVDQSRLALLLAVLEKRMRMPLHQSDVFVSVVGGMKVYEPAIDIGILVAIASSMRMSPIDHNTTLIGEVGLSGELRSVPRLDARLKEAKQMGFKRCVVPEYHIESFKGSDPGIELIGASMVDEAMRALLPFSQRPSRTPANAAC
ncbi:MAG: DNA repair protein RadA, partial [Chlamydiia bacterium]|nr:DNA repair protein RadA [Chlamydiia bacterium]